MTDNLRIQDKVYSWLEDSREMLVAIYDARGMKWPDTPEEAVMFAVSELGEFFDAYGPPAGLFAGLVEAFGRLADTTVQHAGHGKWVRTNDRHPKDGHEFIRRKRQALVDVERRAAFIRRGLADGIGKTDDYPMPNFDGMEEVAAKELLQTVMMLLVALFVASDGEASVARDFARWAAGEKGEYNGAD